MNTTQKAVTTLALLSLLTACSGDNGKGKQNSNHGLINTPPKAQSQIITLDEDTKKDITLKATDEDNDTIGYRVSKQPKHGKLKGKAPKLTYIPDPDYNGKDSFSFIANDGSDDSNETAIELNINPVNDAPVAKDDKVSLDEDHNITIDVLANDSDVDEADKLTITSITTPQNAKATILNNKIIYQPNPNYNGKDSFSYTIQDKAGAKATASVDIDIAPVNDAPVAKEQNISTDEDTQKDITLKATDVDNDNLTYKITTQPKHGKLKGKAPKLTYIPDPDYNGKDSFSFIANDGKINSKSAKINIDVIETPAIQLPKSLIDALKNNTINTPYFTLKIPAPKAKTLTAVNKTYAKNNNVYIKIFAKHKDGDSFYLYNIPLIDGSNTIELNATKSNGRSYMVSITVNADINTSALMDVIADKYDGINELKSNLKTYTNIKATKYMLDYDRDGIIDDENNNGNFTVELNSIGRFSPIVTIEDQNGLLFSSSPFDISLTVKSDANQKDPEGYEPIDIAKKFVKAVLEDDRATVVELTSGDPKYSQMIYSKKRNTELFKKAYSHITKYEQKYNESGDATVTIIYKIDGKEYKGMFQMMPVSMQLYRGRKWIIKGIY